MTRRVVTHVAADGTESWASAESSPGRLGEKLTDFRTEDGRPLVLGPDEKIVIPLIEHPEARDD